MVFKWKEEHTPLFLEHYKKYPSLWNYKTDGYKKPNLRAKAIRSLIKDLNIIGVTKDDIKLKIKSIRTRYTCELAKIKRSTKSGCSTDDIYVPRLFWFKQADEFLNAVCVPRESSSNFRSIRKQQTQVIENQDEGQTTPQTKYRGQPQAANNEQHSADTSHAPRMRKRCNDTPPIDKIIEQLKAICDEAKKTDDDEFDLFCRSLAVQLKKMPLHRALICQQKLQTVMMQERLQAINTDLPLHSPHDSTRSSSQASTS